MLVACNLVRPIGAILDRHTRAARAIVTVPETSMNEKHLVKPGKHKIRLSGKVLAVQPKPVAVAMKKTSDSNFRSGIHAAYGSHVAAALFF